MSSQFHDAATKLVEHVAGHGDDTGRAVTAAIGLFLAHDMTQANAMIEAHYQAEIEHLKRENARLHEALAYWHDVAQLGVTPQLYDRLNLGRREGARRWATR